MIKKILWTVFALAAFVGMGTLRVTAAPPAGGGLTQTIRGTVNINRVMGTYDVDLGRVPVDVVHVLDISGSMNDDFGGRSKLSATKNAVKQFNDALKAGNGDQVGLVTYPRVFSNKPYVYMCQQRGATTVYYTAQVRAALTTDTGEVNRLVNILSANAGTSLAAGLQTGREAVLDATKHEAAHPAVLIVASDGLTNIRLDGKWTGFDGQVFDSPACNAPAVQDVVEQAQLAKADGNGDGTPDVMIYSIAIGDDFDSGLMQAIASEPSSEHFFVAKDAAEMQNVYAQVADKVQSNGCQVRQQEAPGLGALVKIRNAADGTTMQTTTDAEGKYEFEVYPGTWEFESATLTVDGVMYGTFTEGIGGPTRTENPSVVVEEAEGYTQDVSLKTEDSVCPGTPTRTPTAMATPMPTDSPTQTPSPAP